MKKLIILCSAVYLTSVSCKKLDVEQPGLEITLNKLTYKAGDTVRFSLAGNADYVQFYSGETGKNYDLKDTYTTIVSGNPEFQFSSAVQGGNATTKGLAVMVSNDFNGMMDQQNVRSANWADITSRLVLSTNATATSSGVINLNDLKSEGKPLYIAFKYTSVAPATANQWQWTISGFQFRTKHSSGVTYTNAADNAGAGFGPLEFAGDSARWVSGTSLTHVGLRAGYPADEDWAISRRFDLNRVLSDASGVAVVKNISGVPLASEYQYRYLTAGTYKAVFVVRNLTRETTKEELITFNITVVP